MLVSVCVCVSVSMCVCVCVCVCGLRVCSLCLFVCLPVYLSFSAAARDNSDAEALAVTEVGRAALHPMANCLNVFNVSSSCHKC